MSEAVTQRLYRPCPSGPSHRAMRMLRAAPVPSEKTLEMKVLTLSLAISRTGLLV
jgi:hypothetical protein